MVDDQRDGQGGEEVLQVRQVGGLEVDDDMPAQRGDLLRDGGQVLLGGGVDEAFDEVEPHPAHTGVVEPAQLGVGDIGADGGDPAGPAAGGLDGVDHRGVVGAVAGGLHDHVPADPQLVPQGEQLVLAGIARGVLAFRRERELGAGPKTWQWASTAPAGRVNCGVEGFWYQSSQPGVLANVELIVRTVGENNSVRNISLKIVNNLGGEP